MRKGGAAALGALAAIALAGAFFLRAGALPAGPGLTIEVLAPDAPEGSIAPNAPGAPGVPQTPAPDDGRPRVLVYHTHTWEAYEMADGDEYEPTQTWRTMDERYNMLRVGEALCAELEKRGFSAVQDRTAFEPPDLSSAYTRSLAMLEERLSAGEHYDYVLDVHRDAYSGDWNGANAVEVSGARVAYVMLLVGKGTGTTGSGFDERPDWPQNLALAERIAGELDALLPGISREVKIKSGRFNQHVSTGAVLIEIGNNMNTLSEALAACPYVAEALLRAHEAGEATEASGAGVT